MLTINRGTSDGTILDEIKNLAIGRMVYGGGMVVSAPFSAQEALDSAISIRDDLEENPDAKSPLVFNTQAEIVAKVRNSKVEDSDPYSTTEQ